MKETAQKWDEMHALLQKEKAEEKKASPKGKRRSKKDKEDYVIKDLDLDL